MTGGCTWVFKEGETRIVSDDCARAALADGVAMEAKDMGAAPENKALSVPENKAI